MTKTQQQQTCLWLLKYTVFKQGESRRDDCRVRRNIYQHALPNSTVTVVPSQKQTSVKLQGEARGAD